MKKLHLSHKDKINSIKEFTSQEYNEIDEILNRFVQNSKMKWAFNIIKKNFETLFTSTDYELKKLSTGDLLWESLELASLEINRHVLNYLASLNTFLDQTRKFLSKKFGKDSKELSSFDEMTNELFDGFFSYRFLYKLRNFTVHCGFSLCAIEIEYNHSQITFIPKFIYEDLMTDSSFWGPIVRGDLEKIGKDFKAFDLFTESLTHFQKLSDFVISEFIKDEEKTLVDRFHELIGIESEFIDNYCFLVEDNELTKITQIPVHYFKDVNC